MRETGGKEYFEKLMAKFDDYRDEHIAAYGPDNDQRLTGTHGHSLSTRFSYGIADRGASIRVPHAFATTITRAILRIVVPIHRVIPTRLLLASQRPSSKSRLSTVGKAASSVRKEFFLWRHSGVPEWRLFLKVSSVQGLLEHFRVGSFYI